MRAKVNKTETIGKSKKTKSLFLKGNKIDTPLGRVRKQELELK